MARGQAAQSWTEDLLLGGRVRLRQPVAGYRAAIDPVLLAAATEPPQGARVLDLGCGVGAAALCLLARRPDLTVIGLELQPELAALAEDNARLNGFEGRFVTRRGDAANPSGALAGPGFGWVMTNPPYQAGGSASPLPGRDLANRESGLDLSAWIARALALLAGRGGLTLIHRADRLPALLAALEGRAGGIAILPLWPRAGQPARRVLVSATKAGRAPARLLAGLVLHGPGQAYTEQTDAVLRGGAKLDLAPHRMRSS